MSDAQVLSEQLPHPLRALTTGVISERRAEIVLRETRFLTDAHRCRVDDEEVAADPQLGAWGAGHWRPGSASPATGSTRTAQPTGRPVP